MQRNECFHHQAGSVILNATVERRMVKDRQCDAFMRVLSHRS